MVQFNRYPVSAVNFSASSFATGNTPGIPRQTGQTFVFGGAPNSLAHPHHIFECVFNCTCVSKPMTASYSMAEIIFQAARAVYANPWIARRHARFSESFLR